MPFVEYSSVPTKVFIPIKTPDVTTTGLESEHTFKRTPPSWGVSAPQRTLALEPTHIGLSTEYRFALMQPQNPALPYFTAAQREEG